MRRDRGRVGLLPVVAAALLALSVVTGGFVQAAAGAARSSSGALTAGAGVGRRLAGASVSAADASVTIVGHGWGHGRGMGQYGAYGYALEGEPYNWILSHYYGGTTLGQAPSSTINVNLTAFANTPTIVQMTTAGGAPNPEITASWAGGSVSGQSALLVSHDAGKTLTVWTGPGCGGPWTQLTAGITSDVTVTSATETPTSAPADMLQACPPDGSQRWYQGAIVAKAAVAQTWNVLPVDEYVQGVVPRESPASWGSNGGEAALEAQAVAARSYALAVQAADGSICDSDYCQVYGGRAVRSGGVYQDLYGVAPYAATSDAAVSATAGQVLICTGSAGCPAGSVALAEFSSSTGGWTAGGTFPAVVDDGDGVAGNGNPNHSWSVTVAVSTIEAAYPSIGTYQSINVTQRNGDGDLGGRVLQLQVVGTSGTVTTTGSAFAGALGLRSNWFAVAGGPTPATGTTGQSGTNVTPANQPSSPGQSDTGYWLVANDGGIFTFGGHSFYGSTGGQHLNAPVLGGAPTPDRAGYWLVAGDGGIFTFGDARFYGSTGSMHLNQPVVGMAPTADGKGYWLVASDGGIFTFGDAGFYGSTGGMTLSQPIVGMTPTPDGRGYWLVERNGTVYPFGDAANLGSLSSKGVSDTIAGIMSTPDNNGYLLVSSGGNVYTFGDATSFGGMQQAVPGYRGVILSIFG